MEPTSSSGLTEEQILARAHDAQAAPFEMTRAGLAAKIRDKQTTTNYKDSSQPTKHIYDDSSRSWESQVKTFVLGKRQVVYENATFPFGKDLPVKAGETMVVFGTGSGTTPQANGDATITSDAVTLQQTPGAPLSLLRNVSTISTVTTETSSTRSSTTTGDISVWSALLELLTDRATVVTPPDRIIRYQGRAALEGGTGGPIGDGRNIDTVSGGCPVSLDLDTATGVVTIPNVSCTDNSEKQNVVLNFSFGRLTVKGSRIFSLLQNEISGSATGLASYTTIGPKAQVTASVSSNKISGQVTGNNAQTLMIYTTGPTGFVVIAGQRVN